MTVAPAVASGGHCDNQKSDEAEVAAPKERLQWPEELEIAEGEVRTAEPHEDCTTLKAKCVFCSKVISAWKQSTSNLKVHLKRVHPSAHLEYEESMKEMPSLRKRAHNESSEATVHKQMRLTECTRMTSQISTEKFDKLLLNLVVKGLHPLSFVEQEEFCAFVEGICPQLFVMSRRTLGRRIDAAHGEMFRQTRDSMESQEYICLTADIWSTSTKSYMGVTAHWIACDILERRSAALACRRFAGKHSYDRVTEILSDICFDFKLSVDKIVGTVTDNGSNFVKAFKECGAQDDRDDGCDADCEFLPIGYSGSVLSKHIRCACHTLSLIGTTDAKRGISQNASCERCHTAIISKCSKYWNASKRPKSAEIVQAILGQQLITPCVTRWNSFFDAMKRILHHKAKLPALSDALELPQLNDIELAFLEDYCKVLEPISVALDRLQGSKSSFYGELLPTLLAVRTKLKAASDSIRDKTLFSIASAVADGLERRFEDILAFNDEHALIATASHPYFKARWLPPGAPCDLENLLLKAIEDTGTVAADSQLAAYVGADDFFDFTPSPGETSTAASSMCQAKLEVLKYLDDKRVNLSMLHDYPSVKRVFLRYNTNLCSSAPVERLFPFASLLLRPNRRSLEDSLFEQMLLLKCNSLK
ncbi:uncharacterized protein LOC135379046 [Ornithodoros turicata]|uniref:uncharacterized protein LOC135379046 n=1 Tax=Ornithodoros turicata TaxID=34597 RepID=UPI003138B307